MLCLLMLRMLCDAVDALTFHLLLFCSCALFVDSSCAVQPNLTCWQYKCSYVWIFVRLSPFWFPFTLSTLAYSAHSSTQNLSMQIELAPCNKRHFASVCLWKCKMYAYFLLFVFLKFPTLTFAMASLVINVSLTHFFVANFRLHFNVYFSTLI